MGFPTSIDGRFELDSRDGGDTDAIAAQVERALVDARVTTVGRVGPKVTMRVGFFDFRVMNFDVFAAVDSGEVEIIPGDPGAVRYSFSCLRLLAIVSVLAAITALAGAWIALREGDLLVLAFALGVWVVGFGANYLIAALRISSLLHDGVVT